MRAIYALDLVQLDITNACDKTCANCSRFCGHYATPFFMEFSTFQRAVDSLVHFPGVVGISGGEPLLHPLFEEMASYLKRKIRGRHRRGLFTATYYKNTRYLPLIEDIFGRLGVNRINDHENAHHPFLVASKDAVPDFAQRAALIDGCRFQARGAASITPKGAFFCEIAGALSHLFDGPDGWPVEPDWWKRAPHEFATQRDWACERCGGVLALPSRMSGEELDDVSPWSLELLSRLGSPKVARGHVAVFRGRFCEGRWLYDDDATRGPCDSVERGMPTRHRATIETLEELRAGAEALSLGQAHADFGGGRKVAVLAAARLLADTNEELRETVLAHARYGDWLLFGDLSARLVELLVHWLASARQIAVAFVSDAKTIALAVRGAVFLDAEPARLGARATTFEGWAEVLAKDFVVARAEVIGEAIVLRGAPDTAVITALFGEDEAQLEAAVQGLRGQLLQDLWTDHYLVELLPKSGVSRLPWDVYEQVVHIPVLWDEAQRGLSQKEGLLNLGWREALSRHPYDNFILTDADVYAMRFDWFRALRARLRACPQAAVQGARYANAVGDPWCRYESASHAFLRRDHQTDRLSAAGLCWALRAEHLVAIDGLNPLYVDGCGARGFFAELFPKVELASTPLSWHRRLRRAPPCKLELECLDFDLVKAASDEGLRQRREQLGSIIERFGEPIEEFLYTADNGLLAWRDVTCLERRMLAEPLAPPCEGDLFASADLTTCPWSSPFPKVTGGAIVASLEEPLVPYRVFDPTEVTRGSWPRAAHGGLRTRGGGVPIERGGDFFYLCCEAIRDTRWHLGLHIGGAGSLAGYRSLRFRVEQRQLRQETLAIVLTARSAGGEVVASDALSLRVDGEGFLEMAVPLSRFLGPAAFDPRRLDQIVFGGTGGFVGLGEVYLSPEPGLPRPIRWLDGPQASLTKVAAKGFSPRIEHTLIMQQSEGGASFIDLRPVESEAVLTLPLRVDWEPSSLVAYAGVDITMRGRVAPGGYIGLSVGYDGTEWVNLETEGGLSGVTSEWRRFFFPFVKLADEDRAALARAMCVNIFLHEVEWLQVTRLFVSPWDDE